MSGRTARNHRAARVRGAVTIVLAVAAVGGATAAADAVSARPARPAAAPSLTVSAVTPTLLCPGPQTLAVPTGGTPVAPPGAVTVDGLALTTASPSATATLGGLAPSASGSVPVPAKAVALVGKSDVRRGARAVSAVGAVRLDASSGATFAQIPTAALQYTLATTGDLRGLEATGCATAVADTWLVGGGTATGERDRLLLANPTASPATVDLTVLGPAGPVTADASQGVVVPSGTQVAVYVDALAPGAGAIAVHVTARTGRVAATMYHSVLHGFTAGGVDDVNPAAAPATSQLLPGIVVAANGKASVRLVVPGGDPAVARIRLVGAKGAVTLPDDGVTQVPAGAVKDVELTGVAAGTYTAEIQTDVPVVAGALVTRTVAGGETAGTSAAVGKTVPPSELAWVTATDALRGESLVALPSAAGTATALPAISAQLVLTASGGTTTGGTTTGGTASGGAASPSTSSKGTVSVGVRAVDANGSLGPVTQVAVGADAASVVPVAAGTVGLVVSAPASDSSGTATVHAAVVLQAQDSSGPMISVVPVRPGATAETTPPQAVEDPMLGLG